MKMQHGNKWHIRFLETAEFFASWSKDESTKVGCALVSPDRSVIIPGYNGFPRGVADTPERLNNRELKYEMVLHAEENALLVAQRPLHGFTAYTWPLPPCSRCAGKIIQVGIKRVVSVRPTDGTAERWGKSLSLALEMYAEAGVEFLEIPYGDAH